MPHGREQELAMLVEMGRRGAVSRAKPEQGFDIKSDERARTCLSWDESCLGAEQISRTGVN